MKLREILEQSTYSGTFKIYSKTNPMVLVMTKEQALSLLSQELLDTKAVDNGYALQNVNIELLGATL